VLQLGLAWDVERTHGAEHEMADEVEEKTGR